MTKPVRLVPRSRPRVKISKVVATTADPAPPPPSFQFDPSTQPDARMLTQWATSDPLVRPRGVVRVRRSTGGRSSFGIDPDGTPVIFINAARPGDLAHEEGHAVDQTVLTPADRIRFRAIEHDQRQWGALGAARNYPNAPREQWAEAYRILAQHPWVAQNRQGFQRYINYQQGVPRGGGVPYTASGYQVKRVTGGYGFKATYYQLRKIQKLIDSLH